MSKIDADHVFCPHCATKNQRKAYCCLKCFKVMHLNQKLGVFGFHIPTSISVTVIFASLVMAGLHLAQKWLASVEGNMSLSIKTDAYNVSVMADKKKNEEIKEEISLTKKQPE